MSVPFTFFGERNGARILQLGSGHTDAGEAIDVRAEPDAVAPAGAGGETIFAALYLVLTHSMPASITVTPVVDGVEVPEAARLITLLATAGRTHTTHEIPLVRPHVRGGIERSRHFLRGTWFTYRISAQLGGPGDLFIAKAELEYSIVSETQAPAAPAA